MVDRNVPHGALGAHGVLFHVRVAMGDSSRDSSAAGVDCDRVSRRLCILSRGHGVGNWNLGTQAKRHLEEDAADSTVGCFRIPDLAGQLWAKHTKLERASL